MRDIHLTDIEYAVRLYNSKLEIGGNEIKKLFGIKSSATVARLKDQARKVMDEKGAECWNPRSVDTECAYIAWHLNIDKLEKMCAKLKKLNFEAIKEEVEQNA